jgi:hypothetical protein
VVDALSMRIADAGKVIERQRTRIAQQRLEMASLNQDLAFVKGEIAYRDEVISVLRDAVPKPEPEVITSGEGSEAEVHHMPRRILVGHDFVWQELSAEDEIGSGSLAAAADIKIIDTALPTYEVDRQPA